jgi:hypothetical protein
MWWQQRYALFSVYWEGKISVDCSRLSTSSVRENCCLTAQASLNGDFMSLFPTHPNFENSAEEFHPYETLSAPKKLLSSLSS